MKKVLQQIITEAKENGKIYQVYGKAISSFVT